MSPWASSPLILDVVSFGSLNKKNIYIYLFLDRARERERGGEEHQCVVTSHTLPTGDLAATQARALTGN